MNLTMILTKYIFKKCLPPSKHTIFHIGVERVNSSISRSGNNNTTGEFFTEARKALRIVYKKNLIKVKNLKFTWEKFSSTKPDEKIFSQDNENTGKWSK